MSAFRTKIAISPIEGTDYWMVDESIIYQSDLLNAEVTIPAGFVYDGSSLPSWLKAIPVVSYFVQDRIAYPGASALHDMGYRFALWPRKTTDGLYREALLVEKAHPARARVRYWGVRLGGWLSWRQHRAEDLSGGTGGGTATASDDAEQPWGI